MSDLLSNLSRLSELSGSFYFWESSALRSFSPGDSRYPCSFWEQEKLSDQGVLHWGDLCNSSRLLGFAKPANPEEAIRLISERKLWQVSPYLWVPDRIQSGDYGGSVYGLANKEALLEEFGDSEKIGGSQIWELLGDYGSQGVVIDARYATEDLLEALEGLESYPVFCEDSLWKVEERLKEEAFSCFLESDLRKKVEEILLDSGTEEEEAEEKAESLTESDLCEILSSADSDGCLWIAEHNSMHCDLSRVTEFHLKEAFVL